MTDGRQLLSCFRHNWELPLTLLTSHQRPKEFQERTTNNNQLNLLRSVKFGLLENYITSAMFNACLISTLKFQFEKIDKFNNITSVMFNAYLISTLKCENIKYYWEIKKI